MGTDTAEAAALPASVIEFLEQQDPDRLLDIHRYSEALLDRYDLAEEIERRSYGA